MRDNRRYEIEVNEENEINNEIVESERDRMETVKDNINSNEKFEYPIENFKVMPDTTEEIIERSNREKMEKEKAEKALNERDEEISSDFIIETRKNLMKSLTDNVNILSQDEINNIS